MTMNNNIVGLPTSSIMTGLYTQRKKQEYAKNTSILILKETEEGKYYRLRMLNFQPDKKFVNSSNFAHYRDFPFIIQHVHQIWEDVPTNDPEKPIKKVLHSIVCPQTDYVKANSTLSKAQCPMCAAYGAAWKAYTDSHYKNQEAKGKMKNLHNTLRILVPVYVVQDPNREANNGAVKILSLDEDSYQALLAQINASAQSNTPIWGVDACDLFFTYGKVEKVKNEGKSNEFRFKKNGFTRIGFTTSPKHLDGLTDELIEDLQFDANWYTVPTKEELNQFYVAHCSASSASNDDIPMDIPPIATATSTPKQEVQKAVEVPQPKVEVDDIPGMKVGGSYKDVVEKEVVVEAPKKQKAVKEVQPEIAPMTDDINAKVDEILAGISF